MITINQLIHNKRIVKIKKTRAPDLYRKPQTKGVCERISTITPRKPCSARRPIAKVLIKLKYKYIKGFHPIHKQVKITHSVHKKTQILTRGIFCHIPGATHTDKKAKTSTHNLAKFSKVLIRGGRVNDIPGRKYKVIRGANGYETAAAVHRASGRSKYGLYSSKLVFRIRKGRKEDNYKRGIGFRRDNRRK
jgi:small subunit ribosomal protein S12